MQNIDWGNLPFGYQKTAYNVRCYYRDGKWGKIEISSSETINIHMAATALHYGQEAFEGLKAFKGTDGKTRIFRWEENAKRMNASARRIMMPEVPVELFGEAMKKVIELNSDYVPPKDSGASLYLRPLLIGTGAQVGVKPADEYMFLIFTTPVGPYFKEGFKPTKIMVTREFDRAAPQGTGHVKVGGNYAASLFAGEMAHKDGFSTMLYLDSKEKKYIDECGPANFFGIKENTYITPKSDSILPSITNMSLVQIAEDLGMKVERRPVALEELATFEEAGACGTAAVISPIAAVYDFDNKTEYNFGDEPGPVSYKLYNQLRAIQYGDEKDTHEWVTVLD